MEIKTFLKTQRELAVTIVILIDSYWDNEISENQMIEMIQILYSNNKSKFLKDEQFTTVLRQQCGKRRLEVVKKVLNLTKVN
ncbi:glycosyl transferase [Bacillus sp. AFS006103]|nr:glycosyl transferase [Bacillus sp. AFS006103]